MQGLRDRLQTGVGDRYDVGEEIGQGGMAVVFRATDRKHNRTVAIKVLRPELAAALGHDRFLREIEIAAQLQHPHVLPVYDSGESDSLLYYVMPFVAGESLRDRLGREGHLNPQDALRIAREVANALDYAHRQGIVHRDIKPANILLSDGHAVVADFGIARALSESAYGGQGGLTQAGMAVGTPTYMSPEQALGDGTVDGRTDIYALGCVIYEMLAGQPPFTGSTPQTVVTQALSGKRPKLEHDTHGVQPVIERALEREPADRFATAAEMTAALDAVTSGVGYRFRHRRRRSWMLGAAAVAALVALSYPFWPRGFQVEGDPRRSMIIYPFENRSGDAAVAYLEEGAMNLLGLAVAQWQDMRVFDDERTASLLRRKGVENAAALDFDRAQELARDAKVGTLVLGDIRREGDSLAIEAKIHDVRTGERLATQIVRAGWGADPRPLFDDLAARILQIAGAPPGERPDLLAQTTGSLDAYQAYLSGVNHLQHFRIDSAVTALERAIALDTSFALAYVRLRDAVGWEAVSAGHAQRRRELIARAQRYSASLPPRLKQLIQYYASYEAGALGEARKIAESMLARDSTDVEAWYQLGEAHFHDNAGFPPPPTAGNIGVALHAFKQALALDSSYILAYQHILDGLNGCAAPNNGVVCFADTAVYGSMQQLAARFGADSVQRLKDAARTERTRTARGWVSIEPTLPRARQALVQALIGEEEWYDARQELLQLREQGAQSIAAGLEAIISASAGDYGEAGWWLSRGLAAGDTLGILQITSMQQVGTGLLAGAGRTHESLRFARTLFGIVPQDSLPGPGSVTFDKEDVLTFLSASIYAQTGYPPDSATAYAHAWLDDVERQTAGDSARRAAALAGSVPLLLLTYGLERDTTLLTPVEGIGSLRSYVSAHLGLERGDSAAVRRLVTSAVGAGKVDPVIVPEGGLRMVWALTWGDVLARLGELELAAQVFAYADSVEHPASSPGMMVRALAERAALAQRLGRPAEAIQLYERFIEAWEDGDPGLQPLVERARRSVAALQGEIEQPRR